MDGKVYGQKVGFKVTGTYPWVVTTGPRLSGRTEVKVVYGSGRVLYPGETTLESPETKLRLSLGGACHHVTHVTSGGPSQRV